MNLIKCYFLVLVVVLGGDGRFDWNLLNEFLFVR